MASINGPIKWKGNIRLIILVFLLVLFILYDDESSFVNSGQCDFIFITFPPSLYGQFSSNIFVKLSQFRELLKYLLKIKYFVSMFLWDIIFMDSYLIHLFHMHIRRGKKRWRRGVQNSPCISNSFPFTFNHQNTSYYFVKRKNTRYWNTN